MGGVDAWAVVYVPGWDGQAAVGAYRTVSFSVVFLVEQVRAVVFPARGGVCCVCCWVVMVLVSLLGWAKFGQTLRGGFLVGVLTSCFVLSGWIPGGSTKRITPVQK